MESGVTDTSNRALPENICSSSGSRTGSDVEIISEVGALSNSDEGENEDVDISFSSIGETVSPVAPQGKGTNYYYIQSSVNWHAQYYDCTIITPFCYR